jgi:hypothetical protein
MHGLAMAELRKFPPSPLRWPCPEARGKSEAPQMRVPSIPLSLLRCAALLLIARPVLAADANRFAELLPVASGRIPLDLDGDDHADEIVIERSKAKTRLWRESGWVETDFPALPASARRRR